MTRRFVIIILQMLFWYIARNQKGEVGTVPGNFLELDNVPPPIPSKNIVVTL